MGRFPVTSSRGSNYLMVLLDHHSNAILAAPIKYCRFIKLLRAYTLLHAKLSDRGLFPLLQILDDECPASLKQFMHKGSVNYQLITPHMHCTSASERTIQTYKDDLIVGLGIATRSFRSISGTACSTRPNRHRTFSAPCKSTPACTLNPNSMVPLI